MNTCPKSDFAQAVLRLDVPDEFRPTATYIPEDDCLECVFLPDDYYAERIDGLVTVYYSHETGAIVGSLIKGFKKLYHRLLTENPGFAIIIQDGAISLEHLFVAHVMTLAKPSKVIAMKYQKLVATAKKNDVTVSLAAMPA